jgi:hypothetical protein
MTPTATADDCALWDDSVPASAILAAPVNESSGVAPSRSRPDIFYTHDDRGGRSTLYAFDLAGNFIGEHNVPGATNIDWEDLASGPCPDGGDCLYIGDIGDNDLDRAYVTIYVAREPADGEDARVIRKHKVNYGGQPRDAEALLVHPCTTEMYVVTKPAQGLSTVWSVPAWTNNKPAEMSLVASVAIGGDTGSSGEVTGGDFDQDGDRAVLRTSNAIWQWPVDPTRPAAHWNQSPTLLPDLGLADSEAVTWMPDGTLLATSEGRPMALVSVQCDEVLPSNHICEPPVEALACGCTHKPTPKDGLALFLLPLILVRRRQP